MKAPAKPNNSWNVSLVNNIRAPLFESYNYIFHVNCNSHCQAMFTNGSIVCAINSY